MKIELEQHNPLWKDQFGTIKTELAEKISFLHLHIAHIGSTAVPGLPAKPIIDILIGLEHSHLLGEVINPLLELGYTYYPVFNEMLPYRRFFVKHNTKADRLKMLKVIDQEQAIPKSTEEHNLRLAHIHVLKYNSEHWIRHIAFRDYLIAHTSVQEAYQKLKEKLRTKEWADGNAYNKAKNEFIKTEERRAVDWYINTANR